MTDNRLTVVVCCYNGAATLGRTLDALAAQTFNAFEVVVVDDGSSDGTSEIAMAAGARVVRHAKNRGLAAARNTGWRSARTPLVAFTDDDCRPDPTWLAELEAGWERHPDCASIGGEVTVCGENSLVLRYLRRNNPLQPLDADLLSHDGLAHRLALYVRRSGQPAGAGVEKSIASVVGANMSFPVEVLAQAGGFDERFRFGGEEEDLCRRLVLSGEQLFLVPSALVQHDFEAALSDTLRHSRAYGRGNARMYLKHRSGAPTAYPLPVVVAALLGMAFVTGRRAPAALAAALPMLLFSRWTREAVRDRTLELLLYPYLQLAQETLGNIGLVEGLGSFRRAFPIDATQATAMLAPSGAPTTAAAS